MVGNFSWIIPNKLAGCSCPGYWSDNLREELKELKEQHKVVGIVSLTEWALNEKDIKESGMKYLHLPIPDFGCPTLEQAKDMVNSVSVWHNTN
jgi:hypothetical protein